MKLWTGVAIAGVLVFGALVAGHAQPRFTVTPVVVIGDPTPVGGTFAKFEDRPNMSGTDDVVFVATAEGGKATWGVFRASKGTITKVVADNDPTPIGGTFQRISLGRPVTKQGRVVFTASVRGGKAPKGIFLASRAGVSKVVAQGDPTPIGGTFDDLDERPSVNDDGVAAFTATVKGGSGSRGIFLLSKERFTKVVAEGDPTPLGGTFGTSYSRAVINAQGTVIFYGSINGGPTPAAVFLASGGKFTPLLRAGDLAPGTDGGRFMVVKDIDLNERDEGPFRAYLEGGAAPEGVFLASVRGVVKIAVEGERMPNGAIFEAPQGRSNSNARGAVVFTTRLGGVESIFLSSAGVIETVVSHGDPTPVGGTFGRLHPAVLGDSGAIVFRASVVAGRTSEGIFLAK